MTLWMPRLQNGHPAIATHHTQTAFENLPWHIVVEYIMVKAYSYTRCYALLLFCTTGVQSKSARSDFVEPKSLHCHFRSPTSPHLSSDKTIEEERHFYPDSPSTTNKVV